MLCSVRKFKWLVCEKKWGLIASLLLFQTFLPKGESQDFYKPIMSQESIHVKDAHFEQLKEQVQLALKDSWCSAQKIGLMMDLIYQTRPQVCVEIGVFTGSSLLPVASTLKYLGQGQVYAIDAWSNEEAVKHINVDDPNYSWWSTVNMLDAKNACKKSIKIWKLNSYCFLIHAPSIVAVHKVSEIDFLHLDGNFGEEGSLLDVRLFLPKVKSGGYILLSNVYQQINGKHSKMSSMWELFDSCEIIWNLDSNIALFRKL